MDSNLQQANNQAVLFAFGVNHRTASIEVREKMYVHEAETAALLAKLKETLSECVVVSTCNRTEIYGVHPSATVDIEYYKQLLIDFKNASDDVRSEDFFSSISCAACLQLFKVATSIDSKIVGDTQILQQVRHSYSIAKDNDFTGKILNQLLQRAFKIGKKTYLETSIHKGAISISLAAVELARETFGSLAEKTVLIVGAGETAQLTAECLLKKRVGKILVTNRTRVHAEDFLAQLHKSNKFESETLDFEDFRNRLNEVDIIISSTGASEFILNKGDFAAQNRQILLIDIAMPRDIATETQENPFVTLKNIDDLNKVIDRNHSKRLQELPTVKKLIYQEMGDFLVWYYSLPLLPASCRASGKQNYETVDEIKRIKQFLTNNASRFHKMARQKDVKSELNEHLDLVNHLLSMKNASFSGELSVEG
ncbi:MAG TPA: glutamyl-tRNA reductase [Pyrinomonadaceae bacterium]|nr:glutamyl-tRNA reductase [Pyrinomonadaceae bacterium]